MPLKEDIITAITNNTDAPTRLRLVDAFIASYNLRLPNGDPPATNAQKADLVAGQIVWYIKDVVRGYERDVAVRAINIPEIPVNVSGAK